MTNLPQAKLFFYGLSFVVHGSNDRYARSWVRPEKMREGLQAWTETSDEVCPSLRKCNTKCKYVISSLQLCSVPMQYVPFVYKEGLNCDEKRECRISLDWNIEVMTFGVSINSKPFLFSLSLYILVPILVNFGFAVDHARFRSLSLSLSLSQLAWKVKKK